MSRSPATNRGGNDEPEFIYVEPRMETLLAGFSRGMAISEEGFIQNRAAVLFQIDQWMDGAFQVRNELVTELQKMDGGGNNKTDGLLVGTVFREQWITRTANSPKAAAASLATAAGETAKGVEKEFGEEHLLCAIMFGARVKAVKWPILPTMYPELSAWLLAPTKDRTKQLFQVLETVCPTTKSNNDKISIEKDALNVFWEQASLVGMDGDHDKSLLLFVRGKQIRSQAIMYASLRIYALSSFLLQVLKGLTNEKKCSSTSCPSEASPSSLKLCARCHCVQYCSRDCQMDHFPSHKKECKVVLKELYDRYNSDGIETDITTLTMTLEGFMFPNIKAKVLQPLDAYAKAETKRMLQHDRRNINTRQLFRPQL